MPEGNWCDLVAGNELSGKGGLQMELEPGAAQLLVRLPGGSSR